MHNKVNRSVALSTTFSVRATVDVSRANAGGSEVCCVRVGVKSECDTNQICILHACTNETDSVIGSDRVGQTSSEVRRQC